MIKAENCMLVSPEKSTKAFFKLFADQNERYPRIKTTKKADLLLSSLSLKGLNPIIFVRI